LAFAQAISGAPPLPTDEVRAFFQGLEEAFHFFGGVPREPLFDQLRSVIASDERLEGDSSGSSGTGTSPRGPAGPTGPGQGKVEHPIGYLRQGFP